MTSEAGLLAGPFLSLKKSTRSVPKTSAAKMSLLIFIAESNYMHPRGGANVGIWGRIDVWNCENEWLIAPCHPGA